MPTMPRKRATQASTAATTLYRDHILPLFAAIDGANKHTLRAIVAKMASMYGTANHEHQDADGDPVLNIDQADVCVAIASLAQAAIDGETLTRGDMEQLLPS